MGRIRGCRIWRWREARSQGLIASSHRGTEAAGPRKDPGHVPPRSLLVPLACFAAIVLLFASVRILREYERAVVFTLGRFQRVKGPGWCC